MVAEWCQLHKVTCHRSESEPCQNCAERQRPCDVQDGFACIAIQSKSDGCVFKRMLVTCQDRVQVITKKEEGRWCGDLTAWLKCVGEMSAETGQFGGEDPEYR